MPDHRRPAPPHSVPARAAPRPDSSEHPRIADLSSAPARSARALRRDGPAGGEPPRADGAHRNARAAPRESANRGARLPRGLLSGGGQSPDRAIGTDRPGYGAPVSAWLVAPPPRGADRLRNPAIPHRLHGSRRPSRPGAAAGTAAPSGTMGCPAGRTASANPGRGAAIAIPAGPSRRPHAPPRYRPG